jgi:mono/diheme cytochrome c family protein
MGVATQMLHFLLKNVFNIMFIRLLIALSALSFSFSASANEFNFDDGRKLYEERCSSCHELPKPASKSWEEWIHIMVAMTHMAQLNEEERSLILQYLMSQYLADPAPQKD